MRQLSADLQHAIEQLYVTFAPYQLHQYIEGCPCCVKDTDQQRLRAKPLRDLDADDLERYAFKALTTWGTSDDLRHFLPRLFELIVYSPIQPTDVEVLFGKLPYGEWRNWAKEEQQAIETYFHALWIDVINAFEPDGYTSANDYLCAIARAVNDMTPYLDHWLEQRSPIAWLNLGIFIEQNWEALLNRKLSNSFWGEREAVQMHQVVAWLLNVATSDHIKAIFESENPGSTSDAIAEVIPRLTKLHCLIA